jgi:16S rRNA (cytosine1402-N4)-methyltransferase
MSIHQPVLLQAVVDYLDIKKNGWYIDATFGQGGHSQVILEKGGKVLGIEWDKNQYQISKIKYKKEIDERRLVLVNDNFSDIELIAKKNDFFPVDGVLFDLGISMNQIAESGRGFSFKNLDEPLDLRINEKIKIGAADYLNQLSKEQLEEIFIKNAELIDYRRIVEAIIFNRRLKPIKTVGDLITVIDKTLRTKNEKVYRLVWQALRIFVNDELGNLKQGLKGAVTILKKEGRILVISFHSLEDRLVKKIAKEIDLVFLTKKPIVSLSNNYFERSAKLRVFGLEK